MDMERPILVLEEGLPDPHHWLIEKELTTLGRWPDNDIVLPDRLVSRHHALVRRVGSQFQLVDCQSTNGTFVNGVRIERDYTLQDGDRIQIAPHFQLRFIDSASTAPVTEGTHFWALEIDEEERRVTIGEEEVELSVAQYSLLDFLKKNEGRVVSRPEIVGQVWADEEAAGITNQAIDALVRRLRERLAKIDTEHQYIQTVRGHGFKFENRR